MDDDISDDAMDVDEGNNSGDNNDTDNEMDVDEEDSSQVIIDEDWYIEFATHVEVC